MESAKKSGGSLMAYRVLVLLCAVVAVAGCASGMRNGFDLEKLVKESANESVDVTLLGKLKVWGKEVGIYPAEEDFGRMYEGRCISGAMEDRTFPNDEWEGHWAEVQGLLIDWKSVTPDASVAYYDNNCLAPRILLITALKLID